MHVEDLANEVFFSWRVDVHPNPPQYSALSLTPTTIPLTHPYP